MSIIALKICFVWFPKNKEQYKSLIKDPERLKANLWAYKHAKDTALIFRLAVEAKELKRHEVLCVSAENNGTELDSVKLVKNVTQIKFQIKGGSLFTIGPKPRCY